MMRNENTSRVVSIFICSALAMTIGFFVGGEVIHAIYTKEIHGNGHAITDTAHAIGPNSPNYPHGTVIKGLRVNSIVMAARMVAPSVVGIVVTQIQVVHSSTGDNFFDYFFTPDTRPPIYRPIENIGSGFVIGEDGTILTNYHVIKNAVRLYVNFTDGGKAEGTIVGVDEKSDLAVISTKGGKYKPVNFGNSDNCLIGEWSIALGNPFLNFINDVQPTATVGVISALNRNFAPFKGAYYQSMIQTDASINPGNSGGPLVNTHGEVIGINSFIYTGSSANMGSVGIGFAIPINRARRVAEELIAYGRRRPVWTGILVRDINSALAEAHHYDDIGGVMIVNVKPQSPGDITGLRPGDIIQKIDDRPIQSSADLDGFFLDYFAEDNVNIQFVRGGKQLSARLVLKEAPTRK